MKFYICGILIKTLLIILVFNKLVLTQEGIPISTAEKFNERGFSSSSSNLVDKNEIIGEYDGNLSLHYATHYELPNDMSYDVTVNYNANIGHRTFWGPSRISARQTGYEVNKPGWIMGIKGFAVQTTNFETNYYFQENSSVVGGNDVPALIPGYHYTNRIEAFNPVFNEGGPPSDYIQILRADGSILFLQNYELQPARTGRYVETSSDGFGYAIVQTRDDNPYLRKMWYKPGDGLTYYFEEETARYAGRDSMSYVMTTPKIMYLRKIISVAGDTLKLDYFDWSFNSNPNYPGYYNPEGYGRQFFAGISTNRKFPRYATQDYSLTSVEYNIEDVLGYIDITDFTIHHNYLQSSMKYYLRFNTGPTIFDYGSGNKTKYIMGVFDELGRYDRIEYNPHTRIYMSGSDASPFFKFEIISYLPNKILYNNGKTSKFSYRQPNNNINYYAYDYVTTGSPCGGGAGFSTLATLNAIFRDDYCNYMLNQRRLIDSYPTEHEVQVEDYSYVWGTGTGNNYLNALCNGASNIKTEITRYNYSQENSSPSVVQVIKYFKKIMGSYNPYPGYDQLASYFRLISEEINSGNKTSKQINTWDGPMSRISSKEEVIIDGETASKITNYNYQTINASVYGKSLVTKMTEVDPQGLLREVTYNTDFVPESTDLSPDAYYKLNLVNLEKIYSGTSIKSHGINNYFTTGFDIGKIESITKNVNFNPTTLTNNYYSVNEDSSYYGLIKSQTSNHGVIAKYYYPRIFQSPGINLKRYDVQDTVCGYFLTNDGLKSYKQFITNTFSIKPFRTEIIYNNNSDTIKTASSFNTRGQLLFEIDANGYYSEYKYDVLGRMTRGKFPGSFFPGNQTQNDTLVVNNVLSLPSSTQISIRRQDGNVGNSMRTIFIKSGGVVPYSPIEGFDLSKDAEAERGDDYGGGGGSPINQTSDFYIFFPDTLTVNNMINLNYANLVLNLEGFTDIGAVRTLSLSGITKKYPQSGNLYETIGSKIFSFQPNSSITISVVNILNSCINAGKNLFGFKITAEIASMDTVNRQYWFSSEPTIFNASFQTFNLENSNARSSVITNYDDINNKVEQIKRFDHNNLSENKLTLQFEYDSFGHLRKSSVRNNQNNYEIKNEISIDHMGLKSNEKDGENRHLYYSYDHFLRVDTVYYGGPSQYSKTQSFEYTPLSENNLYELQTMKDGENKITKKYFDKIGNLKKEVKVNGDLTLTTTYNYDNLYQLTSVTSPAGKITSYQYDDLNNISQKTSPDEGTTKYKYDKYGNLRFSINTGSSVALTFNKYDNFNRLILTGEYTFTNSFDLLNPDLDYSTNQTPGINAFENYSTNQGNFVLVNMYDKFLTAGVFANLSQAFADSLTNLKGKLVATAFKDKTSNNWWSYKLYSYDYLGRVKDEYIFFQSTSTFKKISNEYDNLGNLTKQNVDNQFYTWYSYDEQARLKEVRSNMHNAYTTAKLEAVYSYDHSDKVLSAKYGTYGNLAPKVLYTYDGKGRVSDINGFALDVFTTVFQQTLTYYNNDNIHTMFLRNDGNGTWPNLNFTYSYDNYNRLTSAACSNSYYTENYTYDNDGNFTNKDRPYNTSQSLTYNYSQPGKNYLMSLTKGGTNYSFTYDYKGNMLTDTRKLITGMSYDRRNLPVSVNKSSVYYLYNYDDAGQRIYKQTSSSNKEYYLRDHTGRELAVYDWFTGKLKMLNLYGNGLFGKVNVSYNLQNARTDSRYYYIKDYLGSIRMTIDEKTFNIVSAQDYFPFGGIMENRSFTTGGNVNDKYKFTEKERDTETNYDYFGARYYDSDLGIWRSVDPLKDLYPGLSPYVYTANNPLRFIDPNGMSYEDLMNAGSDVQGRNGNSSLLNGENQTLDLPNINPKKKSSTTDDKNKVLQGTPFDGLINGVKWFLGQVEDFLGFDIPGKDFIAEASVPGGIGKTGMGLVVGTTSKSSSLFSRIMLTSANQLKSKFKHAAAFGVLGNYNTANASKFFSSINQHINSLNTTMINGTYRGAKVIHYIDASTGLNVISSPTGEFISGWKLNAKQLENVLKHGGL